MKDACSTRYIDSPVGPLLLAGGRRGLHLIEFHAPRHPMPRGDDWREGDNAVLRRRSAQLDEYFAGSAAASTCRWRRSGTAFQRAVWCDAGATFPSATTISYAQLATRVGKPTATRAVGAANGRNPLPIVLPCHRVIGADGSLTGFGGGLPTKQFLLQLEGALPRAVTICSPEPPRSRSRQYAASSARMASR